MPKRVVARRIELGKVAGLEIQEAEGQQFVALDYMPPDFMLPGELDGLERSGAFSKVVVYANGSRNHPREGMYDYREAPVMPFFAAVEISDKWYLRLEAKMFSTARVRFDEVRQRQVEPSTSYEHPSEQPMVMYAEDVVAAKQIARELLGVLGLPPHVTRRINALAEALGVQKQAEEGREVGSPHCRARRVAPYDIPSSPDDPYGDEPG